MERFEKTFDNATAEYDLSRPMYPNELFENIFQYQKIDETSKVLEIGIGTGKATLPFLKKQCDVVAVEPGENLAQFTKDRYKDYSNFSIYNQMLQDYECPAETFDLIYSATAFHWIPEEYGYQRVYELLKKGGTFARFAYHAGPDKKRKELDPKLKELYQTYMGSNDKAKLFREEKAKELSELAKKYGFQDTTYRIYGMTKDFTADAYLKLLSTYPDHMALEPEKREKLFQGIYDAIMRYDGVITVYYDVDLQVGRKL